MKIAILILGILIGIPLGFYARILFVRWYIQTDWEDKISGHDK